MKLRENIIKIVELEKTIQEIYKKLIELEQNNQTQSPIYQENLEYLEMVKEVEQKYFNQLDTSFIEKTTELYNNNTIKYVVREFANSDPFSRSDNIDENLIYQRIIHQINSRNIKNIFFNGYINNDTVINASIEHELYLTNLKNLDLFIGNKEYSDIRDKLILEKYSKLFIASTAESYLLNKKEKDLRKILLSCNYSEERIQEAERQIIMNYFINNISEILLIKDEQFKKFYDEAYEILILDTCNIKSIIESSDIELLTALLQTYAKIIDSNQLKEELQDAQTACFYLTSLLNGISKILNEQEQKKHQV